MGGRGNIINSNDGNGIYRICITMRTDEFMRGDGDNEFNISDTLYRRRYSPMSVRRV